MPETRTIVRGLGPKAGSRSGDRVRPKAESGAVSGYCEEAGAACKRLPPWPAL